MAPKNDSISLPAGSLRKRIPPKVARNASVITDRRKHFVLSPEPQGGSGNPHLGSDLFEQLLAYGLRFLGNWKASRPEKGNILPFHGRLVHKKATSRTRFVATH